MVASIDSPGGAPTARAEVAAAGRNTVPSSGVAGAAPSLVGCASMGRGVRARVASSSGEGVGVGATGWASTERTARARVASASSSVAASRAEARFGTSMLVAA